MFFIHSCIFCLFLDTLKNVLPSTTEVSEPKVEVTSQRKTRPKFVRQKSFEIDSDTDTSLADVSNIVSDTSKKLLPTVNEVVSAKEDSIANSGGNTAVAAVTAPKKKRPALTIKIQNSSFCEQEDDLVSELEKSPNLYISGINIPQVLALLHPHAFCRWCLYQLFAYSQRSMAKLELNFQTLLNLVGKRGKSLKWLEDINP